MSTPSPKDMSKPTAIRQQQDASPAQTHSERVNRTYTRLKSQQVQLAMNSIGGQQDSSSHQRQIEALRKEMDTELRAWAEVQQPALSDEARRDPEEASTPLGALMSSVGRLEALRDWLERHGAWTQLEAELEPPGHPAPEAPDINGLQRALRLAADWPAEHHAADQALPVSALSKACSSFAVRPRGIWRALTELDLALRCADQIQPWPEDQIDPRHQRGADHIALLIEVGAYAAEHSGLKRAIVLARLHLRLAGSGHGWADTLRLWRAEHRGGSYALCCNEHPLSTGLVGTGLVGTGLVGTGLDQTTGAS